MEQQPAVETEEITEELPVKNSAVEKIWDFEGDSEEEEDKYVKKARDLGYSEDDLEAMGAATTTQPMKNKRRKFEKMTEEDF